MTLTKKFRLKFGTKLASSNNKYMPVLPMIVVSLCEIALHADMHMHSMQQL